MKKMLLLVGVILALSSCAEDLEVKAKAACGSHNGVQGFSGSEKRAVCNDGTTVNL